MRDFFHALGAGACAACGDAPAGGEGRGVWERLCVRCGADLPATITALRHPPPLVAAGWCVGPYAGPAGAAVRRAKYGGDVATIDALATLGSELLGPLDVDAVVPVPTPWWRRLSRGMDVPARLAAPLARVAGAPLHAALARNDRTTRARSERRSRAPPVLRATRAVRGRVLLVDDVLTTGATASSAAAELLGAGAAEVWVYVLAAASPDVDNG